MASEEIPSRKGNQRKFQFRQITKDKFQWNDSGRLVTAGGDGKIFKFEGKGGQDHLSVEFLDETKASWTKVERKGEWPNRLQGHSAMPDSMDSHQIFLFGGFDRKKGKRTNDLWLFHTQTLSFKKMEVNSMKPQGRCTCKAVMMGKKIVIFGGWDEEDSYFRDMWMFHLNKKRSYWEKVQCNGGWPDISYTFSCHATDDQTIWTLDDSKTLWKFEFVNCTWTEVGWNMHQLQDPKIFGVGHLLFLMGWGDGNSCQIFCFNAKGHKNSQPVMFVQMTPLDQDSKNVNDLEQYFFCIANSSNRKDGWIIAARTKGTYGYHLFNLKVCDEEIESFTHYIARILMSQKDEDVSLVVGKDKTIILLHKIVMEKSPWIERYLESPSEDPIQMPDCEPKEALSGERKCSICFRVLKSPFQCLIPCGHSTTCADCLRKVRSNNSKCPLCRKDIVDVVSAYL